MVARILRSISAGAAPALAAAAVAWTINPNPIPVDCESTTRIVAWLLYSFEAESANPVVGLSQEESGSTNIVSYLRLNSA